MFVAGLDRKANTLAGQRDRLANLIESETRFTVDAGREAQQNRAEVEMGRWASKP